MTMRVWLLAALVVLLSGAAAFAAPPPAPINLVARSFDNNVDGSTISLSWTMPQSGNYTVARYRVYGRLRGASFALIDTVNTSNVPDSARSGNYYWQHIAVDGTYDVYVTAQNADGESAASDTATVEVVTPPFRFLQWPSNYDSLYVGQTYTTSVTVVATGGGAVRYHVYPVGHNDNTATIDSVTGVFRWTPSTPGQFQFMVVVSLAADPNVSDTGYLPFNVVDPANVRLTSQPLYAQVDSGQTVRHYFRAAGGGGTITYALISIGNASDIDVSIDANTGEAQFTPHAYGMYQFQIGAYVNGNSTPGATQGGYIQAIDPSTLSIHIIGRVIDSAFTSIPSLVKAYRRTGNSNGSSSYTLEDSTESSGFFSFRSIASGAYVLHAAPHDTNHASAYYRANFDVALTWDDATVIANSPNTPVDSVVVVVPVLDGHGSNRLHGRVVRSAGRAALGDDTRSLSSADIPLSDASIFAVDANGGVQGMDVTDANGEFDIATLGAGTFSIVVDRIGYTSTPQSVSFAGDADGNQAIDLRAESVGSTSGVLLDPVRVQQVRSWPTPARDRATISFAGVAGGAEVSVVDGRGRVVRTSALSTTVGENLIVVGTDDLEAGSYIVRIAMQGRMVTAPLVIVR